MVFEDLLGLLHDPVTASPTRWQRLSFVNAELSLTHRGSREEHRPDPVTFWAPQGAVSTAACTETCWCAAVYGSRASKKVRSGRGGFSVDPVLFDRNLGDRTSDPHPLRPRAAQRQLITLAAWLMYRPAGSCSTKGDLTSNGNIATSGAA